MFTPEKIFNVGLPRGMSYYYLYPFYAGFFQALNVKLVLSPSTTKKTLALMETCPTDEPCLAVKLLFAHTKELWEKGIDYLFVPVLSSIEKGNYCCPKFIGAADMLRNGLEIPAECFLSPSIDVNEKNFNLEKALEIMAQKLGVNRLRIRHAINTGQQKQGQFYQFTVTRQLTTPEAYCLLEGQKFTPRRKYPPVPGTDSNQRIGLIGHPYILYEAVSHDLVERTRAYGRVVTAEMVPKEKVTEVLRNIFEGGKLWSFEAQLLGSALYLLRNRQVDKLILVGSFECGPESVVESFIEKEAELAGIPLLILTFDEHTGEAGLITRLEAFMDTAVPGRIPSLAYTQPQNQIVPGIRSEQKLIGFPTMGYLDIALRSAFRHCGVETIKTPSPSKTTIELGRELAPEFACFPLVVTLGQMRQVLEKGANVLLMVGGKGRCRLGWYAQIQEILLKKKGYDFKMAIIDSPVPLKTQWKGFRNTIKWLTDGASWPRFIKALSFGVYKLTALDKGEMLLQKMRTVEVERGGADKIFKKYLLRLESCDTFTRVKKEWKCFQQEMAAIATTATNPLHVFIVGEIWVVLEHFVNNYLEKFLGTHPHYRVYTHRDLYTSDWFKLHVLQNRKLKKREKYIHQAAKTYLTTKVGGHGLDTVGLTVLGKEEGMDGIIHVFPFTCMPEIVAQNILVKVSKELDIPVLTQIISEQTGEAGYQTRLEAFLDVLLERREYKTKQQERGKTIVFSGH
jgi:predicted nucleotide-binding protein (sugar kinase/HSP70/actin superfamily)